MKWYSTMLLIIAAMGAVLHLYCLKRANPWDPVNGCDPDVLAAKKEFYSTRVDSIRDSFSILSSKIIALRQEFENQQLFIDSVQPIRLNELHHVQDSIKDIVDSNTLIKDMNTSMTDGCSSHKMLYRIDPRFEKIAVRLQLEGVDSIIRILTSCQDTIKSLRQQAKAECPQNVLPEYIDRVYTELDSQKTWGLILRRTMDLIDGRVMEFNRSLDSCDSVYKEHDNEYMKYNEQLLFCKKTAVSDPVQLQLKLDSVVAGDTVRLADSISYINTLRIRGRGATGQPWIVIWGHPANKTVVKTLGTVGAVEVAASQKILFENCIFEDIADSTGVRVLEQSDSIRFKGCIFRNNKKHGAELVNCKYIEFISCQFIGNGQITAITSDNLTVYSGLRIDDCDNVGVTNVLAAGNTGCGFDINKTYVLVDQSTFANNGKSGVRYTGGIMLGEFRSRRSLFCYNREYGVFRNNEQAFQDVFVSDMAGNCFFSSQSGSMGGNPLNIEANSLAIADPKITIATGNYSVGEGSVLYRKGIGFDYNQ